MADASAPADTGKERIEVLKDRLDDPRVAGALETLLDHADLLAVLVQGTSDLMSRSGEISKTVAGYVAQVRDVGQRALAENLSAVQFQDVTSSLITLGRVLGESTPAITRLIESDTISPEAIDVVALAARSLVTGYEKAEENQTRVGLLSLPGVLRDPDVSRALGFLIEVARALGVALREEPIDFSHRHQARQLEEGKA